MRIGIIGLGSIGRRHVRALNSCGVREILAFRTGKGTLQNLDSDIDFVQNVTNFEDFKNKELDGIIISNPTSEHISTLKKVIDLNVPIFVEKPLSHSLNEISTLDLRNNNIIVGYCLRFSPTIAFLKKELQPLIGQLVKASFKRSYYLPKWHPYADYRKEYTALKSLGGGVLKTLSHEIDLMLFLFEEEVIQVSGYAEKLSFLEIDTDDVAFFSCKVKSGARVNFELDFLSPSNINRAEFYGENGVLRYDYTSKTIEFEGYDSTKQQWDIEDDDVDKMYVEQMQDFITFIKTGISRNTSLVEAIESMRIINEIEGI